MASIAADDVGLEERAAKKWPVIRYALDSNARTARLCVITLVAGIPADLFLLVLRH